MPLGTNTKKIKINIIIPLYIDVPIVLNVLKKYRLYTMRICARMSWNFLRKYKALWVQV